jgi:CubicO group peptidase (beta-lactamase class C family)
LSGLFDFARTLVDARLLCNGVQISCSTPDRIEHVALGEAAPELPVNENLLYSVVCATKPILGLAVGLLGDQGLIDLATPVRETVDPSSVFAGLDDDLWSVMNHSAPLAEPDLLTINLCQERFRPELVGRGIERHAVGYSEYAASLLLASIVQRVTGEPALSFIDGRMLTCLGLEEQIRFGFTRQELLDNEDRIGVYVVGLPDRAMPLLHDRSPHQAHADRLVLGGYASAKGLSGLYARLGSAYRGEHVPGLPAPPMLHSLLAHENEPRYERYFRRTCQFAGGFMVDLPRHGFGDLLGSNSFGHSGYLGRSFGFYDPESQIAGAAVVNGLSTDPRLVERLRYDIVEAIFQCAAHEDRQ